jgi:hypothetical protein
MRAHARSRSRGRGAAGALAPLLLASATIAGAQPARDAAVPGAIVAEPSTPTAVALRWPVEGDANTNAVVAVSYRKRGAPAWSDGYPLFRTYNDRVSPDNAVPGGHLFAGSVVDLEPDTEYEVRLALRDPDGGSAERVVALRTAAWPGLPDDLADRYVTPASRDADGSGTKAHPYRGLRAALAHARPGDRLVLAPGVYSESALVVPSGEAGKPVVVQGQADGSAVLDGGSAGTLLDLSHRAHVWLDRLVLRNAAVLVRADKANDVVLARSRLEVTRYGLRAAGATYGESMRIVVTDNEFAGRSQWPRSKGIEDVNGVTVTGSGHVIAYNRFHDLGDGVHNGDEGRLSASDVHHNDFDRCTDDAIEADYSDTNIRVFRNRITNAYVGISLQPAHGGPVYVFRNLMLNLQSSPFKFHNDTAGALIFHNTAVKSGVAFSIANDGETVRDVVTRNNLFVGTGAPALYSNGRMSRDDFDSDGYDWPRGAFAQWMGRTYPSVASALGSGALYSKLGAVAMGPPLTFAARFGPPPAYEIAMDPAANTPLLAPASKAIDRGVRLPGFNDRFGGAAPDLGCCELGEPLPEFGPRPGVLAAG